MSQSVLITGGASGLGRALALRYARAGYRVCITDVNDAQGQATLEELNAIGRIALYRHADVTREADLSAVADELEKEWGGIDILINNAGVAQAGAIEDVAISDWEWILNINLLGAVRGCKVFTPMFKRQGHGHIVNVASMAGLLDVPLMASYNVSKAGLIALSGTLEQELMAYGIEVSVVCPSFFMSNLEASFRTSDPRLRKGMKKLLAHGKLSAGQIAEIIFDGVRRRKAMILPHREGKRAWLAKRFLPHRMYRWLMQRTVKKTQPPSTPRMKGSGT
jgi:NAD(P)-dependent dehydrogenase (short-subunit alcohol dehydrogenase family)